MKKIFATLALCVMTLAASAQVKSIDIKGDLRHDFGLGVGATFGIVNNIDFAPSFNWYFPEHGHMFTVDADFHYDIALGNSGFTLYPVVGVALGNWGGGDHSATKLGFDLGGGVKYNVVNNINIFCEGKWQWFNDNCDDAYISLGVNIGI